MPEVANILDDAAKEPTIPSIPLGAELNQRKISRPVGFLASDDTFHIIGVAFLLMEECSHADRAAQSRTITHKIWTNKHSSFEFGRLFSISSTKEN